MIKFEMRWNGKKIASGAQLQREFENNVNRAIEHKVRQAAGPGVRLEKTRDGFVAKGTAAEIAHMKRRLGQ